MGEHTEKNPMELLVPKVCDLYIRKNGEQSLKSVETLSKEGTLSFWGAHVSAKLPARTQCRYVDSHGFYSYEP